MRTFPQPGAATLVAVVFITCLMLFLFQKIIWLVLPALIALMLFYCLRPAVKFLVRRGLSHGAAAKLAWFLLQVLSAPPRHQMRPLPDGHRRNLARHLQ